MKNQISVRQFTILVALFTAGNPVLLLPGTLVSKAGPDAWIATGVSLVAGCLLVLLFHALYSRFPEQNLMEIMEEVLGKWIGKIVALLFILAYPLLLTALVLRDVGDFITSQPFPETPILAVEILFILVVMLGVHLGMEVMARTAELFFPLSILLLLIWMFALLPELQLDRLQPMLEKGFSPVWEASIILVGFPYLELVIFLMIMPLVNEKKKVRRGFLTGVVLGGAMIAVVTFYAVTALGVSYAAIKQYPAYELGQMISIEGFLERIEVIVAGFWLISIFVRAYISFFVLISGFSSIFGIKDARSLIAPMGILVTVLSLHIIPNTSYLMRFTEKIWTPYGMIFGLFLPMLLWGIGMLRKKSSQTNTSA
ncbi:GerAB/ArcD/ProY family transporter [Desmospora profundinema]|uniref:Spore germination protein KB n=1 Tax=Desmospora profundinema TaxID=1571184 RepID=A0ABU1IHX4_9BACL|nr:endospore germination permease [Desmospora profundinema]MDR6224374.1 spore germination protein KB [Desmospora profundinema]